MKIINLLLCLFVANIILSSCWEDKAVRDMLDEADRLLVGKSDSALLLLDSYEKDSKGFSRAQRMRYEMLRALAQNSEDVLFSSDSILLEVVDYYNSHGSDHDRMRANYALGSVYRDLGDAPTAIQYYNDAVSYADTTSLSCDFRTLSRIYGQMASLFHSQRTPEFELECERKAVNAAWKARDTVSALIFEDHYADAYSMKREDDSVLFITDKVKKEYEALGLRKHAARSVYLSIRILEYRDSLDEAKKRIDLFKTESGFFDENGEIAPGLEYFYVDEAIYFERTGQIDSAYFYYNKSLQYNMTLANMAVAYLGLMRLAQLRGDNRQVCEYAEKFAAAKDTEVFLHAQDVIAQTHALYNYNTIQKKSEKTRISNLRLRYTIIIITIVSLFLVLLITCLFVVRERKLKDKMVAENAKYVNLLSDYSKSVKEYNMIRNNFEDFMAAKEKEIKLLNSQLTSYQKDIRKTIQWDKEQSILTDPIVLNLHTLASHGMLAPSGEILAVIDLLNSNNIKYKNLIEEHQPLTEKEIIVCALIRLQFLPSEISVLLNMSISSVTNYRTSINKKLFSVKGTKGLEYNLISNT